MSYEITATVNQVTRLITGSITNGSDGSSAYEIAVENGYEGSETEWLESLKGDKGDTGPAGQSPLINITNEQKVISNTALEVDINNGTDYQGSRTIAANSVLKGDLFEVEVEGLANTTGAVTATIRIYWGPTLILTSTEPLPNNLIDCYFGFRLKLRIISTGATGSILGYGRVLLQSSGGVSAGYVRKMMTNIPVNINTLPANDLKATYQFSVAAANNSLRVDGTSIKKHRVNV